MIDTEALRKKVIDLAIQGKLTEQLPSDGNAETLYAKILNQKSQLINEGKIRKDKELPDIAADEVPFEIPSNWKWVRFGTIITLQSGQDLNANDYNSENNGIPYITGASNYRDDGSLIINRWTDSPKAFAQKGDILLSCKGTVGKLTILNEEEVHIARQIMGIRTYSVSILFIRYFVDCMIERIKSASKGLIPGIERNDILSLCCPLPPITEQKRIVERIENVLTEIDVIDNLQAKYSNDLVVLKSKIIDAGIRGKLTEQLAEDGNAETLYSLIQEEKGKLIKEGKIKKEKPLPEIGAEEIPFEIPNNWKWVRLGNISSFSGGYAYKSDTYVDNSNNQVIRLGNVKQDSLLLDARPVFISDTLANETEEYRIRENDILVTMTGTRRRKDYFFSLQIDNSSIKEKKLYLNQRVGCIRTITGVLPGYLVKALQNTDVRNSIFSHETGAVNQGNLGSEDIKRYVYIPLPPMGEQRRIVDRISKVLDTIS